MHGYASLCEPPAFTSSSAATQAILFFSSSALRAIPRPASACPTLDTERGPQRGTFNSREKER